MTDCIQLEGSPSSLYSLCINGELFFSACSLGLVYRGPYIHEKGKLQAPFNYRRTGKEAR